MNKIIKVTIALVCLSMLTFSQTANDITVGIFDSETDIGKVGIEGSASYDSSNDNYSVVGSGENMWFEQDAFHYVWKKVSGDVNLSAEISWVGDGVNPHRKAGVIIRQNLKPGSKYADVIVHGDGLTSLQYRNNEDSLTYEIRANISKPNKLKIHKEGSYIHMSTGTSGEDLEAVGGNLRLKFEDPFYVGIGVCSHDSTVIEKAIFTNVILENIGENNKEKNMLESTLEIINIESKNRSVIYNTNEHIEAPNWSLDGKYLVYNSNGLLYKKYLDDSIPKKINTGFAVKCNNDHGLSPDNKLIVISDQSEDDNKSRIYTLPIEGGVPKLVTNNAPSYWHGWSPDGSRLAYCAERNGQYDIYSISVNGGDETQLTNFIELDDGPDYSPDGKYIYFNSARTGKMQIWRMNVDGSEQTQLTYDEFNDWFPHPSPDGKWLVFVSYDKDVEGHPANKDVTLRIMPVNGGEVQTLTKLFGGQGTINVPSWSPDSKNVAFVSYRLFKSDENGE